eukprot:6588673-Alexandrium_andersonii.AAC.1
MGFSSRDDAEPPGRGLVGWKLEPAPRSSLEPRISNFECLWPFCVFRNLSVGTPGRSLRCLVKVSSGPTIQPEGST